MKNNIEEYDEIYGCGFEFTYRNKRLGHSKPLSWQRCSELGKFRSSNDDHMFVKCGICSEYMDYISGTGNLDGKWICPNCSVKVRESTAYNQISRENINFENKWGSLDSKPDICESCGGPYPDCMTSCKIFDD